MLTKSFKSMLCLIFALLIFAGGGILLLLADNSSQRQARSVEIELMPDDTDDPFANLLSNLFFDTSSEQKEEFLDKLGIDSVGSDIMGSNGLIPGYDQNAFTNENKGFLDLRDKGITIKSGDLTWRVVSITVVYDELGLQNWENGDGLYYVPADLLQTSEGLGAYESVCGLGYPAFFPENMGEDSMYPWYQTQQRIAAQHTRVLPDGSIEDLDGCKKLFGRHVDFALTMIYDCDQSLNYSIDPWEIFSYLNIEAGSTYMGDSDVGLIDGQARFQLWDDFGSPPPAEAYCYGWSFVNGFILQNDLTNFACLEDGGFVVKEDILEQWSEWVKNYGTDNPFALSRGLFDSHILYPGNVAWQSAPNCMPNIEEFNNRYLNDTHRISQQVKDFCDFSNPDDLTMTDITGIWLPSSDESGFFDIYDNLTRSVDDGFSIIPTGLPTQPANISAGVHLRLGSLLSLFVEAGPDNPDPPDPPAYEFEGLGTAKSPYLIPDVATMLDFSEAINTSSFYSNAYFKQTAEISLLGLGDLWTPVGDYSYPFSGHYDGQNFEVIITDQNTSRSLQGLFGYVDGAEIKNVNVNGQIGQSYDYVGCVAAYAYNSTFDSCQNHVNIDYGKIAGGIVGCGESVTVKNCVNLGKVISNTAAGGIVGKCDGKVEFCFNFADVDSDISGGIVGVSSDSYSSLSISKCVANCNVEGSTASGILGKNNLRGTKISNCGFYGGLCLNYSSFAGAWIGLTNQDASITACSFVGEAGYYASYSLDYAGTQSGAQVTTTCSFIYCTSSRGLNIRQYTDTSDWERYFGIVSWDDFPRQRAVYHDAEVSPSAEQDILEIFSRYDLSPT